MGKLSCNIHAQGLTRNVLQAGKGDYDNHYKKTMTSKLRAVLQMLPQMCVLKTFNKTVVVQGTSIANALCLQTEGGRDLFKGGYG